MAKFDVCVVGETNLDLILYGLPKDLELDRELLASGLALTLGSSAAIFAHNLAALGTSVGFVSMVGSDPLGKIALERIAASGVDIAGVKQTSTETLTGITVSLPYQHHRYILTYPGTMFEMKYSDIDMGYIRSARHLHLSSFFLLRALRPQVADLFREARAAGLTTSLDTNDDPEDRWGSDLLEVLQHVDICFANEREIKKLARKEDVEAGINFLAGLVRIAVVKRGPAGAICQMGNEQWSRTPPIVQMVDDVGAGDSFDAGFIYQYLRGAKPEDCLSYGNLAGAYSTTKEGGTEAFRDRNALARFIAQHWTTAGESAPAKK